MLSPAKENFLISKYLLHQCSVSGNSMFCNLRKFACSTAVLKCMHNISNTLPQILKTSSVGHRDLYIKSSCCVNSETSYSKTENEPIRKSKKQDISKFTIPVLMENVRKRIQSAASIHITPSTVAWAKMSCDNHLLAWNVVEVPNDQNKIHPTMIYETVLQICDMLPTADVYVMEDMNRSMKTSGSAVMANTYVLQMRAMLIMLLNKFHEHEEDLDVCHSHKVYFLRSHLSARLFSTLVGSERVSAATAVTDVLKVSTHLESCQYSPITVDWSLKNLYLLKDSVEKENLGQVLLLIMTFFNLVVHKRPGSLKHITL